MEQFVIDIVLGNNSRILRPLFMHMIFRKVYPIQLHPFPESRYNII